VNAVLTDPLLSRLVYGVILGSALFMTWRSGDEAMQKTCAWLLVDWVGANLAYEMLGASYAPWATPTISALICVPIGNLALRFKSYPAWSIVGLMVGSLAVSVGAFAGHWQGGYNYFAVLNVLFVLRAVVLGGAAGALAYRNGRRGDRAPARAGG
jgi:hypothetical protein